MKFLIDAQLPKRLADWLTAQGFDARHTHDLHNGNRSTDAEVIRHADGDDRIVVNKDADFVNSFQLKGEPARLLLVLIGNVSNAALLML